MPHSLGLNLLPQSSVSPQFLTGRYLHALFSTLVSSVDIIIGRSLTPIVRIVAGEYFVQGNLAIINTQLKVQLSLILSAFSASGRLVIKSYFSQKS